MAIKITKEFTKRQLKVYSKYKVNSKGGIIVSEIRLSGKWLQKLGFESGKFIELNCEQHKITITLNYERES